MSWQYMEGEELLSEKDWTLVNIIRLQGMPSHAEKVKRRLIELHKQYQQCSPEVRRG